MTPLIQSHLGSFAIVTVGKINNEESLIRYAYENNHIHFMEMSGGRINATELTASIITQKQSIVEGLLHAQEMSEGSRPILILTPEGIYASRDRYGRTPVVIGRRDNAFCVSFESFAYINLGYHDYSELGPGRSRYPTSGYEGVNVEEMRYRCGRILAQRDMGCRGCTDACPGKNACGGPQTKPEEPSGLEESSRIHPDIVAGVPDSGIAHAIGYANGSGIRVFLVRGTQLGETTEFLYQSGAKEVHIRPACPPLLFGCKYLNFSRSNSDLDLITRRIIREREGEQVSEETLFDYADPDSQNYKEMVETIRSG